MELCDGCRREKRENLYLSDHCHHEEDPCSCCCLPNNRVMWYVAGTYPARGDVARFCPMCGRRLNVSKD